MPRGEIWLINLDPTVGADTDWKTRYALWPWMVRLEPTVDNNLTKLSAADTFQVRSVSQERFIQRLGYLSEVSMQAIAKALAIVLRIR